MYVHTLSTVSNYLINRLVHKELKELLGKRSEKLLVENSRLKEEISQLKEENSQLYSQLNVQLKVIHLSLIIIVRI